MPLDPISVGVIMRGALLSAGLVGVSSNQLALGLTNALCVYGKTAMNVTTVDVGTVGVGKGTGFGVFLVQPAFATTLAGFLPANGIAGLSMPQIVAGVSVGYTAALATAVINTIHPSVGAGSGKLQILPNTVVAVGIFMEAFLSSGMTGLMLAPLSVALANSLDIALASAVGVVTITGPSASAPSSGLGTGKLI